MARPVKERKADGYRGRILFILCLERHYVITDHKLHRGRTLRCLLVQVCICLQRSIILSRSRYHLAGQDPHFRQRIMRPRQQVERRVVCNWHELRLTRTQVVAAVLTCNLLNHQVKTNVLKHPHNFHFVASPRLVTSTALVPIIF